MTSPRFAVRRRGGRAMRAKLGRCALALAGATLVASASAPAHADRNALWTIVHDQCVPRAEAGEAPKPCEKVDLAEGEARGVALLKDRNGVAQYLAIPTGRVAGIEDAKLLAPDAPTYFAFAWASRSAVEARLKTALPREALAITVNSAFARSQDQLHLHIDCVRPDVVAALAADRDTFDETWRVMATPLNGRRYWARRLDSADLGDAAPFRLLADGVEGARARMDLQTIAAVGATFAGKPGFVLLADHAELTAGGHAEDLQDHDCAIAKPR